MNVSEETKNHVTPYAFGVSDALLGKALASPSRRLCAVLIDLVVVASLTLMSTAVFAFVVLLVSIAGYLKSKARQAGRMTQNTFVFMAIVASLFLSSAWFIDSVDLSWISSDKDLVEKTDDSLGDSKLKAETSKKKEVDSSYSLIAYFKGLLADMGLGFGWAAVYFSVFVAWFNGQTIGKMLFRIRVVKIDSKPISFWESFERYGGYSAGLATGLMGFVQIFWDPNRQAIHDKISETVVLDLRKPDKVI